jgi:subtilisin-like proprotein convertase family protein
MNYSKRICFFVPIGVLMANLAFGQTSTNTFSVNQAIPQGSKSGLANTQHLDYSGTGLFQITDLQVTLNISGGFNGDYYAYLVHDNGFAVLLNRPGRTSANSAGYADSGMNITLSSSAATDIHNYQTFSNPNGGLLTGLFAEDGRNVDSATVLDTDSRTALLGSFNGTDPSGQWTLFLADLDYGEQGQLVSWGLVVTAVPEPGSMELMLLGLAGMLGLGAWVRRRK